MRAKIRILFEEAHQIYNNRARASERDPIEQKVLGAAYERGPRASFDLNLSLTDEEAVDLIKGYYANRMSPSAFLVATKVLKCLPFPDVDDVYLAGGDLVVRVLHFCQEGFVNLVLPSASWHYRDAWVIDVSAGCRCGWPMVLRVYLSEDGVISNWEYEGAV